MAAGPEAFFVAEGERLVATVLTRGPWSAELEHGGPGAGLLARAIERAAGPDFEVARISVEFLRPIPIGTFTVASEVVRAGKKVQVLGATLSSEKAVARATAVCIRRAPVAVPVPAAELPFPLPEVAPPFQFPFFHETVGYHTAMEMRLARGRFGEGSMAAWMRMRVPLVLGEAPSPLQRVIVAADSGNGVSVLLDPRRYTFVNPDLTVALRRPLEGEWVCLDARTAVEPIGLGLADTALFDARGAIGRSLQTLVVEERAQPGKP